jgi:hypothetical protein
MEGGYKMIMNSEVNGIRKEMGEAYFKPLSRHSHRKTEEYLENRHEVTIVVMFFWGGGRKGMINDLFSKGCKGEELTRVQT